MKIPCLKEIICSAVMREVLVELEVFDLVELVVILWVNKSGNPKVLNLPPNMIEPRESSESSKTLVMALMEEFSPKPLNGVD